MTRLLNSSKGKTINLNDYITITPDEHMGSVIWEKVMENPTDSNYFSKYDLDSSTGILTIASDAEDFYKEEPSPEDGDVVRNPWTSYTDYYFKCYSSKNSHIYAQIYIGYQALESIFQ